MSAIRDFTTKELCDEVERRDEWSKVLCEAPLVRIEDEAYARGLIPEFEEEVSASDHFDRREIEDAYKALTPSTPEPIRAIILELAGRIA